MTFQASRSGRSSSEPPGPSGLPLVGNTVSFVRDAPEFFEEVAEQYGDVASLRILGFGELLLVTEPDHVERMLVTEFDRFTKPSTTTEALDSLFGDGIVNSVGDLWRRQRTLMQPAFARDRIADYADLMADHAATAVDGWAAGETVDVEDEMKQLTLRILVETMFGSEINYEELRIREMAGYLEAPGKPRNQPLAYLLPEWVPIPMWRRYHTAIEHFEGIISRLIWERRDAAEDRTDLLSTLLAATDDEGHGMSDEQLRDEMMAMLFAGHETTAISLTYATYLVADDPDVQERLQAEADAVLGDDRPTAADVPALEYTRKVFKEALRLYPPSPLLVREPKEDVELGGYDVPAGSTLGVSTWAVHRDERFYDDPETFRPDRWTDEFEADLPSYAYVPFGGGPRQCLGQHFAMFEALFILATMAQRVDLELVSPTPVDTAPGLILLPTSPVEVAVQPR